MQNLNVSTLARPLKVAAIALLTLAATSCGEPTDESPRIALARPDGLELAVLTCDGDPITRVLVGTGDDAWADPEWTFRPTAKTTYGTVDFNGSGTLRLEEGSPATLARLRPPLFVRVEIDGGVDSLAEFERSPDKGSWIRRDEAKDRGNDKSTDGDISADALRQQQCGT